MQPMQMRTLQRQIFKTRNPSSPGNVTMENCVVHSVSGNTLTFIRPALDKGKHVFGPAAFTYPVSSWASGDIDSDTIPAPPGGPAAGYTVLIAWVQGRPWALAWSPT